MGVEVLTRQQRQRLMGAALFLLAVIGLGSVGYWILSDFQTPWLDCLYMAFITITTIGYGEIIEPSQQAGGRVLSMGIAFAGIGALTYLLSNVTALIVEGELSESFRRRRMERSAAALNDHYIVCGLGGVGRHIIRELMATQRPCIVIDDQETEMRFLTKQFADLIHLDADPSDNEALMAAGIERARGVFAATDDDNRNLVIALSAKQLNPRVKVVAQCQDPRNSQKTETAGADAVVSPSFIGGLRMASEMVRPAVVSFLDVMLRDQDKSLRIEELPLKQGGQQIGELGLDRFPGTLLLAVRSQTGWTYNPARDFLLGDGSVLVVMTTAEERQSLERHLANQTGSS